MSNSELWQRIKEARSHVRLNQEDFGGMVGVHRSTVSSWESRNPEKRTVPSSANLHSIARVCECTFDWLQSGSSGIDIYVLNPLYILLKEGRTIKQLSADELIEMMDDLLITDRQYDFLNDELLRRLTE